MDLNWMFGAPPASSREPIRVQKLSSRKLSQMRRAAGNDLNAAESLRQAGYSPSDIASYFEAVTNES